MVFFCVFLGLIILCEFVAVRHCKKNIFFLFVLSAHYLYSITDRNEAIIVELKALSVLNSTFITFSRGSIIR